MKRVGFIGWRGMVGSVLMQRMREENDFALVDVSEGLLLTTGLCAGWEIEFRLPGTAAD